MHKIKGGEGGWCVTKTAAQTTTKTLRMWLAGAIIEIALVIILYSSKWNGCLDDDKHKQKDKR